MTRHQVGRYEERLRGRAKRISQDVKAAKADGFGRPWTSRDTGLDMSYEFEHWRRWAWLAEEMQKANAEFVADLGAARVMYWHGALDPEALQPPPPPHAYQPVTPLVRRIDFAPPHAFRRPADRDPDSA
jgi:hypothetical protein